MDQDQINVNIDATFRIKRDEIPSRKQQYERLWLFATVLAEAGLSIEKWHPGEAGDAKTSLMHQAFTAAGPTEDALALAEHDADARFHTIGVWNGVEGKGGVAFLTNYTDKGVSTMKLQSVGAPQFFSYKVIAKIVEGVARIWPTLTIEVGPFKYFSQNQVFPDRPGVGWMLYLPRILTPIEVPEARALIPVEGSDGRRGTLIVSETEDVFDVESVEHIRNANTIEIRLADQDFLPRYRDL